MNEQEIDLYNKRFGTPGRIAFRSGATGAPVAVLVNRYGSCELSMDGAQVLSYRPTGHMPVLFNPTRPGCEGTTVNRGGISVAWPWVGEGPSDGLPYNGFARLQRWRLQSTEYTGENTELTLTLTDSDASRKLWPHAFALSLRVWLDQRLNLALTTVNGDSIPITFSLSLAPHLRVRQIMDANVRGLDGSAFLDRCSKEAGVQRGPLNIRSETDRIFTPEAAECVVHDPGIGRVLAMTFSGATELAVWNPWKDRSQALPDFGDDDYTRMLAMGPTHSVDHPVTLAPGEKHTLTLALQATLS